MSKRYQNKSSGKNAGKGKSDPKQSETAPAKKAIVTEIDATPTLTVLQLQPSNYPQWQKNNEHYFAHTYGLHGSFFETQKRYAYPVPKRPVVRAPAGAAASSSSGRLGGGTRRSGRAGADATASALADRGAEEEKNSSDEDSSSDNDDSDSDSSSGDSDYDGKAPEDDDIVETEEAADYTYQKRLDNMERDRLKYMTVKPQMYSDLMRSLGTEAEAVVRTSSKFKEAHKEKNEVLLRKICHKKLRQYSAARGVSKEIKSAKQLYMIHQFHSEHTSEYYERFKREVDAYETYSGETLSERRKAALFTDGLNNARYGVMKVDIENGDTKRKSTLTKAYKQAMKRVVITTAESGRTTGILASNYTAPQPQKEKKAAHAKQQSSGGAQRQAPKASTPKTGEPKTDSKSAGSAGHSKGNKFACTTCKLLGEENFDHRAHECPNESKAAAICREASMFTDANVDLNPPARSKGGGAYTMMTMGTALATFANQLQEDEIVFDPGTTIMLFKNRELLDEGTLQQVTLDGIETYGGKASASMVGTYRGIETYVAPNGPANLFSHAVLKRSGARTQLSDDESSYSVTFPDGDVMDFVARDDLGGLFVYTPLRVYVHFTAKENLKLYTRREQRKAIEARTLLPALGFPSDKDYASILNNNVVKDLPVTSSDVYRAHRIFGKDIPSYMGKTTRRTSPKIDLEKVDAVIQKRVWLGMDVFIVNSGAYMLSVSSFKYKMVTYMGILNKTMTNNADTFWFHIRHHVNSYRARGFAVFEIRTDDENAFVANKTNIQGLGIVHEVLYGRKVEEVERGVRPIKERHRAYVFYVPFPLTQIMEVYLVLNCARLLNAYPSRGNGYEGIAPTEIYRGTKLNRRIDFPLAYGDVCLVHSDIGDNESKTSKARGEIVIAMLPHGNSAGDITFLNTRTMHKLVRNEFTVIPTPQFLIDHLKQHVGNRYAAMRRNPIYRTLSGDPVDDAPPEPVQEAPQQLAEAAEPVIPVNRETSERVDDESIEQLLPLQAPEVVAPAAEPAPAAMAEMAEPAPDTDEELPDAENSEAPTLNAEDLRRRYPLRSNRSTWKEQNYFMSSAKIIKANKKLNLEPRQRLKAMAKEIYSIAMLKKGMTPVNPNNLTHKQLKGVISSKLFTKVKFSPDGEFEKWKARLVAGGHMQNREEYTYAETSSPTVGTTAILTVAAIAAKEKRKTATVDFTAAYLNAKMTEGKLILMRLSKETSVVLCLLVPAYRAYLRPDGTMIVKLTKALYGCVESAKLWYNSITHGRRLRQKCEGTLRVQQDRGW